MTPSSYFAIIPSQQNSTQTRTHNWYRRSTKRKRKKKRSRHGTIKRARKEGQKNNVFCENKKKSHSTDGKKARRRERRRKTRAKGRKEKPYCLEREKNDRYSLRRVYYHAVLYNTITRLAAHHTHIVHHIAYTEKQREAGCA